MNSHPPSDFGKQLGQIVQNAIQTGDYSQLKSAVNVTVQEIQQTVNTAAKGAWNQTVRPPNYRNAPPVYTPPPPPARPVYKGQGRPIYRQPYPQPRPQPVVPSNQTVVLPRKQKVPGSASGTLLLIFGILGLIPSAITLVSTVTTFLVSGSILSAIVSAAVCGGLTLNFLAMIFAGKGIRNRVARFRHYRMIMGNARYYSIEQLAEACGESKEYLVRDLRRMIRKGMFTDAYIDHQESCIMLDRATYQQYLATRQHIEQQKLMEQKRLQEQRESAAASGQSAEQKAAAAVVAEGQNYIRQIKLANDAIPNEEISTKLYRLETITTKVFAYVETHPQKLPEIRKFMNYYLPTTLKLVNAYREFDAQPVDGSNITGAKQEIQDILDTINGAFENLLDSLFADDAMDISSDISALNIMLSQDGLTGSDFKNGTE